MYSDKRFLFFLPGASAWYQEALASRPLQEARLDLGDPAGGKKIKSDTSQGAQTRHCNTLKHEHACTILYLLFIYLLCTVDTRNTYIMQYYTLRLYIITGNVSYQYVITC